MGSLLTTITELGTALGMLGHDNVAEALEARPVQMVSVSPEQWMQLDSAYEGGRYAADFESAFANGQAFLRANDGLRERIPRTVEWRANSSNPGDTELPVDLRIDHVFLVSCKYLSKNIYNTSPTSVFDHALRPGSDKKTLNWYPHLASVEFQHFYEKAVAECGAEGLPRLGADLTKSDSLRFLELIPRHWPADVEEAYISMGRLIAAESAKRWSAQISKKSEREKMFWRLLRFGPAPYFVLGSSKRSHLRLRIATPWDWRQSYEVKSFSVAPKPGGQPMVKWSAIVRERHGADEYTVDGHVEIRWSHGRFNGGPEAKIYLDTPHELVPGYFALV